MLPTPRGQYRVLRGCVGDMVRRARAVGVAEPLGVPRQAHGFLGIAFQSREWWKLSTIDLVMEHFRLDRAGLKSAKKRFIGVGVVYS